MNISPPASPHVHYQDDNMTASYQDASTSSRRRSSKGLFKKWRKSGKDVKDDMDTSVKTTKEMDEPEWEKPDDSLHSPTPTKTLSAASCHSSESSSPTGVDQFEEETPKTKPRRRVSQYFDASVLPLPFGMDDDEFMVPETTRDVSSHHGPKPLLPCDYERPTTSPGRKRNSLEQALNGGGESVSSLVSTVHQGNTEQTENPPQPGEQQPAPPREQQAPPEQQPAAQPHHPAVQQPPRDAPPLAPQDPLPPLPDDHPFSILELFATLVETCFDEETKARIRRHLSGHDGTLSVDDVVVEIQAYPLGLPREEEIKNNFLGWLQGIAETDRVLVLRKVFGAAEEPNYHADGEVPRVEDAHSSNFVHFGPDADQSFVPVEDDHSLASTCRLQDDLNDIKWEAAARKKAEERALEDLAREEERARNYHHRPADAYAPRDDRSYASRSYRPDDQSVASRSLASRSFAPQVIRDGDPADPSATLFIMIQPNLKVPLRRVPEVQKALEQDYYDTPDCPCCARQLAVIADAAFLACPLCHEMSPLFGNIRAVNRSFPPEPEYLRFGLGLGMTWETLQKVQQEIHGISLSNQPPPPQQPPLPEHLEEQDYFP